MLKKIINRLAKLATLFIFSAKKRKYKSLNTEMLNILINCMQKGNLQL